MKLLLCPKGYVGTKVELNGAWLDVYIDLVTPEERGYTVVDDHIAGILLQRPGYEIVPERIYPRSLEELKGKVGKDLLNIGGTLRQPAVVNVETLPTETRQHIQAGKTYREHRTAPQRPRKSIWHRLTQLFRR